MIVEGDVFNVEALSLEGSQRCYWPAAGNRCGTRPICW